MFAALAGPACDCIRLNLFCVRISLALTVDDVQASCCVALILLGQLTVASRGNVFGQTSREPLDSSRDATIDDSSQPNADQVLPGANNSRVAIGASRLFEEFYLDGSLDEQVCQMVAPIILLVSDRDCPKFSRKNAIDSGNINESQEPLPQEGLHIGGWRSRPQSL